MQHKVVIVQELTNTTITIGGTMYFGSQQAALDFVQAHNGQSQSRAYIVQVAADYVMTDRSQQNSQ